jgi:predicted  nucleic acid-binding Zn-ribbon protein
MTINKPNTELKAQVTITCLSTGLQVQFFPYDFEFDDVFRPEWGTYDGFGRMDPVMTYKRTSRTANLSFNVVAESKEDAESNFSNLQTLIQGLYPKYKTPSFADVKELETTLRSKQQELDNFVKVTKKGRPGFQTPVNRINQELQKVQNQITNTQEQNQTINDFGIRVIDRSPLFKINFMNLLNNDEYVVAVTNFKHKMKFDAADTSLIDGKAIPGEFNINMSFTILHTDIPGNNLNYDKVFDL